MEAVETGLIPSLAGGNVLSDGHRGEDREEKALMLR